MKTLLIFTNMMFVSIIIFMSCNKNETLAPITSIKPCPDCYDHGKTPFKGINTETAKQLSRDYQLLNQPKLVIDETEPDATSIWFSAEAFKNFLWKIEEEACRRGCGESLKLGLRLYYGRYPDNEHMQNYPNNDFVGLPPGFQQHHTLFIVPTFQDPLNPQKHCDFDPWHWGSKDCTPMSMTEWYAFAGPKPFGNDKSLIFSLNEEMLVKTAGGLASVMNHGNMIPPGINEGTGY